MEAGRIGLYSEPALEKQLVKAGGWTTDELFMFMQAAITGELVTGPTPTRTVARCMMSSGSVCSYVAD